MVADTAVVRQPVNANATFVAAAAERIDGEVDRGVRAAGQDPTVP